MLLPGYAKKAIKQFNYKQKKKKQPYPSVPIKYGAKKNILRNHHQNHFLTKRGTIYSKSVRKCFFTGRAVDRKLMCPISAIASQSENSTKEKRNKHNNC